VPALLSLAYAIAVVVVAWSAPDKGFNAFTGHRVIHVDDGGRAEAAGLREGDVIVAVDGRPVTSTLDYAFRTLRRSPGETVTLDVRAPTAGSTRQISITLGHSPPPWSALVATVLAVAMMVLGLIARIGRPDDIDARRFYRTTVLFSMVYVGALSWPKLLVRPELGLVFLAALFIAPAVSFELTLDFPHRGTAERSRASLRWRNLAYGAGAILTIACTIAVILAIQSYRSGGGDAALRAVVLCIALQCATVPVLAGIGLVRQIRAQRTAHGSLRAQLRWMLYGHTLSVLPVAVSVPVALLDVDKFLIVRYQPFVATVAVLWSLGYGLAVLRIRLADVDALIKTSLGYAVTTGAAVLVYLGVVLGVGWATGELVGDAGPWPHVAAACAAAIVFGPIRSATSRWLDRRFFRDRTHYVEALRRASESLALLREPGALAREAVEQIVAAVRAERGALYMKQSGTYKRLHAIGEAGPEPVAPADGIAVPVTDARTGSEPAWLVLGPRKSGDLYSSADLDLIAAFAGQLAVALANARAFGTIKELSTTLQGQNEEIRELRDRLEDENRFLRKRVEAATEGATLVGESKAIRELQKTVDRVAKSDSSVLLLGESGTGKGLTARLLHATSARAGAPFMQVDCGAIAPSIFESELFGHERGAFTGATRMRRGPIELADGGTLFLDEIGELPLELQPKLLRVLENKTVMRVGATQPVSVDVRIIAATNRKLDEMVAAGQFREDLYFRLRVVEMIVPSLRARRSDLRALCESLLPRVARRCGHEVKPVSGDALRRMLVYAWPGNVRELENVLERALVLGEGPEITAADLDLPDREAPADAEIVEEIVAQDSKPHDAVMDEIERRRLVAALSAAEGNQSHAAKALGMPRTTFINKLRRHGLL